MVVYAEKKALHQELSQNSKRLFSESANTTVVTCTVNGEEGKESGNGTVTSSCLDIEEYGANGEITGEKKAYVATVLERYTRRWHERSKHHLGNYKYFMFLQLWSLISLIFNILCFY